MVLLSQLVYYFLYFRHAGENDVKIQSDISKLKEWFQSAQLDPNDPTNVALIDLLKVKLYKTLTIRKVYNSSVARFFDLK